MEVRVEVWANLGSPRLASIKSQSSGVLVAFFSLFSDSTPTRRPQIKLTIDSVHPGTGVVSGSIDGLGSLTGVWDETTRTLTFACPTVGGPNVDQEGQRIIQRWYKGFLFSTPRNPAPGEDVVWTLTGFVQLNDLTAALSMGGNARRNAFGWFAQITEVT
jgi:hypothetical protein